LHYSAPPRSTQSYEHAHAAIIKSLCHFEIRSVLSARSAERSATQRADLRGVNAPLSSAPRALPRRPAGAARDDRGDDARRAAPARAAADRAHGRGARPGARARLPEPAPAARARAVRAPAAAPLRRRIQHLLARLRALAA